MLRDDGASPASGMTLATRHPQAPLALPSVDRRVRPAAAALLAASVHLRRYPLLPGHAPAHLSDAGFRMVALNRLREVKTLLDLALAEAASEGAGPVRAADLRGWLTPPEHAAWRMTNRIRVRLQHEGRSASAPSRRHARPHSPPTADALVRALSAAGQVAGDIAGRLQAADIGAFTRRS
jgi:hypothetical protein